MKNLRLLTDEQLVEAVLRVTRFPVISDKTGWQAIAEDQDVSTLKAVGEWLSKAATSGKPIAAIVAGIVELKQGRMPKLEK